MFRSISAAAMPSGANSIFIGPTSATKRTALRISGWNLKRNSSSTGILPVGPAGILPVDLCRLKDRQDACATSLLDPSEQEHGSDERDHEAGKERDQIRGVELKAGAIKIHQSKRAAEMGKRK